VYIYVVLSDGSDKCMIYTCTILVLTFESLLNFFSFIIHYVLVIAIKLISHSSLPLRGISEDYCNRRNASFFFFKLSGVSFLGLFTLF